MAARQRVVAALATLMRALRKDAPPQRHSLPSLRRAFSIYDQINLIDNVPEDQLRFQEIDDSGFKLIGSSMKTVQPLPDILILGCGRHIQPVDPKLCSFIRSTGMKLEAIDSRNAALTYNILNEEGRIVAAALLPYGVFFLEASLFMLYDLMIEKQFKEKKLYSSFIGLVLC